MKTKDHCGKLEGYPGMSMKTSSLAAKSGNVLENKAS
jgi:hypothetical protein